ncbi:FAD-dependent oxidoreductase [Fundicoccus culcitae]|uniref:Urocanate reductase n=1 Tax=Fundicoccus culcitae TaxID=2969821 RepID=A0ABY5P9W6_9LACT|nr:FAD-dependent oxidoreductase [Fundicoccus culcitae]UUX35143.1 FAD-dependent oxidoreductase [Fundicoccus culcitae]
MVKKIGKWLVVFLVMLLAIGGINLDHATAVDGVFQGSSSGMQGPITAEITVENNQITDITFPVNSETVSVARVAFERIPQQIIEYQSLSMDVVTGATLSSNAIIRAVTAAAEEAGLDVDAMKANEVVLTPSENQEISTDILVIGGGGAGFSAAITAAQEGKNVILIEKSSFLGGNTLMAGDAINAVDPEAQKIMILSEAQKDTLDSYLALTSDDENLKFEEFPEWQAVLEQLQADITKYYEDNEGTEAGVDMPGFDSVALHMWHTYTGGLRELNDGTWVAPDYELAKTLAEGAFGAVEWMDEVGLEPSYGENAEAGNGQKGLYTVLGAMWPRTHTFIAGEERIDILEDAALSAGVEVYKETRGTELITNDDGAVIGVKAVQADGSQITFNTIHGVIIASGGYSANPAMVKEYDEYWGDDLTDRTLSTNVGTNEGDGIVMAQAVGADVVDMGIAQLMPSSSPVKGTMTDGIWADAGAQIWINADGERFVNEYAERDVLAQASLEQENGIFYIIYAGVPDGSGELLKGSTLEDSLFGNTVENMLNTGHIWYGETLAELAEATQEAAAGQIPAFTEEQLRATIEQYNSYAAEQHDPDFGKEVISGAIDLDFIDNTEGYGIVISPRKASLHHTMGGIKINEKTEVLDTEGNVIPGLWAAGEVTGGVHAGNRLGGNAISDVFTFGTIAGENAANSDPIE